MTSLWRRWLLDASLLVGAYAVALVVAGTVAGRLFDVLGGMRPGPLRSGEPWAWPALVASVGNWFVLDTGLSLVVGSRQHAAFNLGFVVALGVPLLGYDSARRRSSRAATHDGAR